MRIEDKFDFTWCDDMPEKATFSQDRMNNTIADDFGRVSAADDDNDDKCYRIAILGSWLLPDPHNRIAEPSRGAVL